MVSYEKFSEDVLSSQWRLLFRGLDFVPAENISCYGHSDGRIIFILPEHLLTWAAVLELLVRPLDCAAERNHIPAVCNSGNCGS